MAINIPKTEVSSGGSFSENFIYTKPGKYKVVFLEGGEMGWQAWVHGEKKDGSPLKVPVCHSDKDFLLKNFKVATGGQYASSPSEPQIKRSYQTLVYLPEHDIVAFADISHKSIWKDLLVYAENFGEDVHKKVFQITTQEKSDKDKYKLAYFGEEVTAEMQSKIEKTLQGTDEKPAPTLAANYATLKDAARLAGESTGAEEESLESVANDIVGDDEELPEIEF